MNKIIYNITKFEILNIKGKSVISVHKGDNDAEGITKGSVLKLKGTNHRYVVLDAVPMLNNFGKPGQNVLLEIQKFRFM